MNMFAVIASLLLISTALQADPVVRYGEVSSTVGFSVPPYTWYDQCEKKRVGIIISMTKKALASNAYQFKSVAINSPATMGMRRYQEKMKEALLNDKIDLYSANGLFEKDERLLYSNEPAFSVSLAFVIKRDNRADWDQKKIVQKKGVITAEKNSALVKAMRNQGMQLDNVVNMREAMLGVLSGHYDYMIALESIAHMIAVNLNATTQLETIRLARGKMDFFYATRNNAEGQALLNQLDKTIQAYRDEKYLAHLKRNYILRWMNNRTCSSNAF